MADASRHGEWHIPDVREPVGDTAWVGPDAPKCREVVGTPTRIRVTEAARLAGVCRRTMLSRIRDCRIKVHTPGRRVQTVAVADLVEFGLIDEDMVKGDGDETT